MLDTTHFYTAPDSRMPSALKKKKMFQKVLLVQNSDSLNIGLTKTLSEVFSFQTDRAKYGDKALLMVKKALLDKEPYDLIITDLSFNSRGPNAQIPPGEALLREIHALQPDLKCIVYSIEDRPHKIRRHLASQEVDAYVLKGPESTFQMVEAIRAVNQGESYLSPELSEPMQLSASLDIDPYDLLLLKYLSEGYSQQEISKRLKKQKISPHSLSSVEKRTNRLKEALSARNIPNLIALAKDMGLI